MRSTMPYRPGPGGRVVPQRYQSTAEDGSRTTQTVLHTLTAANPDATGVVPGHRVRTWRIGGLRGR